VEAVRGCVPHSMPPDDDGPERAAPHLRLTARLVSSTRHRRGAARVATAAARSTARSRWRCPRNVARMSVRSAKAHPRRTANASTRIAASARRSPPSLDGRRVDGG